MFKKPLAILIAVIIIILVIVFIYRAGKKNDVITNTPASSTSTIKTPEPKTGPDYKNISYTIDGEVIKLTNGKAETPTSPGSVSVIATEYFGNEATGDVNGDGTDDKVFFIAQEGGGTGIFYYVVAALSLGGSYKGTSAVFVGDRIAPKTIEIRNGQIIVNYADRGANEPMSAEPSIAISKYFKVTDGELVDVK